MSEDPGLIPLSPQSRERERSCKFTLVLKIHEGVEIKECFLQLRAPTIQDNQLPETLGCRCSQRVKTVVMENCSVPVS